MQSPWSGNSAWAFFAGIVTTLYLVLVAYGYFAEFRWPEDWLPLAMGLIGSVVTFAAVLAVYRQVQQSAEHKEQDRIAINFADRAALNQPLSNILQVQASVINLLRPLLGQESESTLGNFSAVSHRDLDMLIRTIRSAETLPRQDISKLVAKIQIQRARLSGESVVYAMTGRRTEVSRPEAVQNIVDALLIYGRAQRLLYYARLEEAKYDQYTLAQSFDNAIFLFNFDTTEEPLAGLLQLAKARNDNLWGLS